MSLFFLLLHLTCSVQGIFTGETPPAVHETEEDDNFTLGWDSLTQTNTTLTSVICFLLLSPPKVLYRKISGAEAPESQDGQFSGRVQSDGREGRLRLHLFRLRTEDSGSYRCDLAAYNQVLRKWELQTSVTFVLNVTKTSRGDTSASLNTPKPRLSATAEKQKLQIIMVTFGTVLLVFFLLAVAILACRPSGIQCTGCLTRNMDELEDIEINGNDFEEMNLMINH
ncbi:uncharacterized protein LOC116733144 isoform X1 [Xiphophorus hellerii]|uniref:uncharacterized protein LOC116733144 isoform X1 n=1 Tax=Xiphophorus hellerii TaxID=8084 RepID=UPI0013B3586F|nr:uncharacterized protein LOC116733144 isoform X1 [Xiphophorus hellerii]XP_032439827.1 uncharacterized protein LOC116733144 isoform X1 [Xiphophorus hellerii]XP_032439828.1 uncharacterized protein LOC116733144 isoform X1 [Xiphophorus hellerii]XP_032439830.1 uncharacterized protein LOC116733144 isoform X1 [Xiphophorus hellerii]XP_032439831.1 uncharacterized protein LOC116733144 isoform X1 [Xiphophorus hellerii]XP_032439832.1 uncharacterized protein LOC116733144 isoform X1 [Xiphophorus hellerii]